MRVVNGMHWPNDRPWNIEQCLRAARSQGSVTLLHFQMFPFDPVIGMWGDAENDFVFVKLRDGYPAQDIPPAPERFVHVRMYLQNWTEMDPLRWAQHAVDFLSRVESGGRTFNLWQDPFVGISPANEQNLHYESGDPDPGNQWKYQTPEAYTRIGEWNLAFWREVDRLLPERKALAVWSALAYGHDAVPGVPDSEYQVPAIREAIEYCDLMASHPYGHLDWPEGAATVPGGDDQFWHMLRDFRPAGFDGPHDRGGILAQFPGRPLLITESGTFVHSDPTRTQETIQAMRGLLETSVTSMRVLGTTWFIWNSDDAHRGNRIWPNEDLRRELEALPDYETSLALPAAAPPSGPGPGPDPDPDPGPDPEPGDPVAGLFPATRVQRGEGMFAVARRVYGDEDVADNARMLADVNGLDWPPALAPGQILETPGFDVVQPGRIPRPPDET